MNITTLMFDLGDVLILRHPERALEKFSKLNGRSLVGNTAVMQDDIDYMRGRISPSEFAEKHLGLMNLPISEEEFHRIYTDIFSLNEGLFDFLKRISAEVNLVMLSNTEKVTIDFLTRKYPELFSLFNHLVFSFEVHMVKPEKEIFIFALRAAVCKPENAVYIDDKKEYVEAAQDLGINAFRFTTLESIKKDLGSLGLVI